MLALTLAMSLAAAPQKLDWKDFWNVSGVTRDDKKEDVIKKWGAPTEDRGKTLRWKEGPTVDFREDGATQLDFSALWSMKFVAAHKSPPLELLDMPCDAAAKRLAFAKKIESYTSCKHYDASGWLLDVTMMCTQGKVTTLVVVWVPVPELKTMKPLPADHC